MAESYWRKVHQRALRDARHALGIETRQRVVKPILGTVLLVASTVLIASVSGVTNDLTSKILAALSTTAIVLILLLIFYVWNFVQAPARLDCEAVATIDALQLRLEDQKARRNLRRELWLLREEGVQLRNKGQTTRTTTTWKEEFEIWRGRVLEKAEQLSADLRHSLDPLDKIAPESQEAVGVSDHRHRLDVSVLSEMLTRLYKFLSETGIQDGRHVDQKVSLPSRYTSS
jgi:hypothetical protein